MVADRFPQSKAEALALLAAGGGPVVAGGTDLMVKRRRWSGLAPAIPETAVYVANIAELSYVKRRGSKIEIGGATPLEIILEHPLTPALLRGAIKETGSPGIRNTATLGGNLVNASPAADPALALTCLGASVRLESVKGVREVPVLGLSTGPGRTILNQDELLTAVLVPMDDGWNTAFVKVGGRKADAISKVSFASAVKIDDGIVTAFAVAFGAVGPTILRLPAIERTFVGLSCAEVREREKDIILAYGDVVRPIDDQRSNAHYRKTVALNLLSEFIRSI
ncbi:MAG TPA: molybdopterin dehydrogenase [Acholeplasmatales bacterium]|nr:MAG: hypothetical protein A2Y16_03945 [Tenericutes bacterium GWF2_57_13]HAQ57384.1 molybdopterin dehydrogenase [Acholeplasmatales bacterium]